MSDWVIWILAAGYLLTWLLIPWVLLRPNIHASSAVAWILSIIFLPYLGALLFAIFGGTRWEVRAERKHEASVEINRRVPDWADRHLCGDGDLGRWAPLAGLAARLTGAAATRGNQAEILDDTQESLARIEELIEGAEHWVHVEFYIWRNDKIGQRVRDLLIEKARQGVQVRFLYDGLGSLFLSRKFLKPMEEAGVQTAAFTPGPKFWHLLTLNLRNHRKAVIADGRAALTGGMNIGHEYLHPTAEFGELRDTQVCFRGPAVLQFQQMFAQDWFYATGEALTDDRFFPAPDQPGQTPAQVVADGPDNDVDTLYSLKMAALGLARERVTIVTPYFIPPDGLAMALETAALRGVRVRLLVAKRGNFTWTLQSGRSYYDRLLRAGAEIYEYQEGLLHGKTLTVDGQWSLVGTTNWDYRSLFLNFEVSLAMFDESVAQQLEQHFEKRLKAARQIDPDQWRNRPTTARLQEQFWRLFAPVW